MQTSILIIKIFHIQFSKMKKCKSCHRQLYSQPKKREHAISYKLMTEYGINKIVSPPKLIVCNDQYMLEFMIKTQRKTNRLDKQVHKIKNKMKKLQESLEKHKSEIRNERNSHVSKVYIGNQEPSEYKNNRSRGNSISQSKNREIGRFTRASERESKKSQRQRQKLEDSVNSINEYKLSFSEKSVQLENNYAVSFSKKINDSRADIQSKQIGQFDYEEMSRKKNLKQNQVRRTRQNDISKYLPSYQESSINKSENLLESQEQMDQIQRQQKKSRLLRQFEQLSRQEKFADPEDQRIMRTRLKQITQLLTKMNN